MISSHQNSLIKQIKRLKQKKYRVREQAGVVEGLRGVLTAVEQRPDLVEMILYAPDLLQSTHAQTLVQQQEAIARPVSAEVFRAISERDHPTGLVALVKTPVRPLDSFAIQEQGVYIALHDISDPGNLGTILRTVDASGANGVILVGQTTDVTHPAALKASMGTAFTVSISAVAQFDTLQNWVQTHQLQTVATTANSTQRYWDTTYKRPLLLHMGNEQKGLPDNVLQTADQTVTIPMNGQASSLNLAIATSLLLYEIARTR